MINYCIPYNHYRISNEKKASADGINPSAPFIY